MMDAHHLSPLIRSHRVSFNKWHVFKQGKQLNECFAEAVDNGILSRLVCFLEHSTDQRLKTCLR